jgi:Uma2 family endonuclease
MDPSPTELTPQQPTAPALIPAAEYVRLIEAGVLGTDDRVELLGGVIVAMPSPNPPHATATMLATEALQRAVRSRAAVRTQQALALGAWSIPEPDVAVVPGSLHDYANAHPTHAWLVVEVSDWSLKADRLSKSRIYAAAGVPEYWIVNLRDRVIEVMGDPDAAAARYRTARVCPPGETLELAALPGARVEVGEILPRVR